MSDVLNVYCYACNNKTELESEQKILRHEECPHCQISLHCCKMCVFYDTTVYNECKEPLAERLVEKEKANFCSYFKLGNGQAKGPSKDDLFSAADALFKKD